MVEVAIASDDANISAVNFTVQGSAPATPGSGHVVLYSRNGLIYKKASDGVETLVGTALALTQNNLLVGDANDLAEELPPGTDGQVPTVQADLSLAYETPAGGGGGDLVYLAQHVVPAGGEASFSFASIAATYSALLLECLLRSDRAGQYQDWAALRFNDDSGANYGVNIASFYAGNSAYNAYEGSGQTTLRLALVPAANATALYPASIQVKLPFYAGTIWYKGLLAQAGHSWAPGDAATNCQLTHGRWVSTAAINKISFHLIYGTIFLEGSVVRLYGVT
jgi:hypothetical protein